MLIYSFILNTIKLFLFAFGLVKDPEKDPDDRRDYDDWLFYMKNASYYKNLFKKEVIDKKKKAYFSSFDKNNYNELSKKTDDYERYKVVHKITGIARFTIIQRYFLLLISPLLGFVAFDIPLKPFVLIVFVILFFIRYLKSLSNLFQIFVIVNAFDLCIRWFFTEGDFTNVFQSFKSFDIYLTSTTVLIVLIIILFATDYTIFGDRWESFDTKRFYKLVIPRKHRIIWNWMVVVSLLLSVFIKFTPNIVKKESSSVYSSYSFDVNGQKNINQRVLPEDREQYDSSIPQYKLKNKR